MRLGPVPQSIDLDQRYPLVSEAALDEDQLRKWALPQLGVRQ